MTCNCILEEKDNIVILKVMEKAVESEIAASLKTKIIMAAKNSIKGLILDLSNVNLMDSSGLGALLLAYRLQKDSNFSLILVGVQDFLQVLMNITKIEENFTFADSVENAISMIK